MGTAWPIEVLHSCKFATQYTAIIMQWYTMSHFAVTACTSTLGMATNTLCDKRT